MTNVHLFIQRMLYFLSASEVAITLYSFTDLIHINTWEMGVTMPISQIKMVRPREVKELAPGSDSQKCLLMGKVEPSSVGSQILSSHHPVPSHDGNNC